MTLQHVVLASSVILATSPLGLGSARAQSNRDAVLEPVTRIAQSDVAPGDDTHQRPTRPSKPGQTPGTPQQPAHGAQQQPGTAKPQPPGSKAAQQPAAHPDA